jgi:hypothetical protein
LFLQLPHLSQMPTSLELSLTMAHASGSESGGFTRLANFTEAEAWVLLENRILVPLAWHLPNGWHVSAAGYAVPPLLEGTKLEDLISRRWQMVPMHEQELIENAPAMASGYHGCSGSGRMSSTSSPGHTLAATM